MVETRPDKTDAEKIKGKIVDDSAIGNDKVLTYKTASDKIEYGEVAGGGDDASLLTKGTLHVDRLQVLASDTLRHSNDGSKTATSTSYVKKKEMKLTVDLKNWRAKFTLYSNGTAEAARLYGRIYKNGVAVGTERSTIAGVDVEYSEDFSDWVKDDLFQIYIKQANPAYDGIVKNQRIFYDVAVTKTAPTNQDP